MQIDRVSIGGVVLNTDGRTPEAGVWVIAETSALPTHFRRIVVTDDRGRFVVPDLPEGSYEVWVRGYGLRDSTPVPVSRGQQLTLDVADAASPQAAAQIYPANYWLSLYEPPAPEDVPDAFTSQDHWVARMKLSCIVCHQLGATVTRLSTSPAAWEAALRRTLKTTNGLESINALIEERCAKVDHWQNSSQRQRWLRTALLDIEPRLRKVMGYRHLPRLRDALKRELKIDTTTSKTKAA